MNNPIVTTSGVPNWQDISHDEEIREEFLERARLIGVIGEKGRQVAGALANADDVDFVLGVVRPRRRAPGWKGFKLWFFGTRMKLYRLGLRKPLYLGADGRVYVQEVVSGTVYYMDAELSTRRIDVLKRIRHAIKELGNETH